MSESMRVNDVSKIISIAFFVDGLCVLIAAIFFKYISKDWRIFYGIPLGIFTINLIWLLFQEDTPTFSHSMGRYDKARKLLTKIGRTNLVLGKDEEYKKVFRKEIAK